jgi:hypothetical protein
MRVQLFFGVLLLFFTANASVASENEPFPNADTVVARMLAQDAQRQTLAAGYRGMRRYVLENERMHKRAEMLVRVECDANGTKHFEVIDRTGWKAAYEHVLHKMLDSEAEASEPQVRVKTRLSQDNYDFHMVGDTLLDDRTAYLIAIVPKRREERLFEGRIWVDARDYALVRAEGKIAKNPSFWTRNVQFTHTYQKSGQFWFPASTESVTEVRVFGSTSLTINYFDYTPTPLEVPLSASAELRQGIPK